MSTSAAETHAKRPASGADSRWWNRYTEARLISGRGTGNTERNRTWVYAQRVRLQAGLLSADKAAALAELGIESYDSSAARYWRARYEDFTARHGRKPSRLSEDPDERALANAAGRYSLQKASGVSGLATKRTKQREDLWQKNFADLAAWMEGSGRLPKMRAPDAVESAMANFINNQRRELAAGKLLQHRETLLRGISGVLEPRPKDRNPETWQEMLEEFFLDRGRYPSSLSADRDERSLCSAVTRHGLEVSSVMKSAVWWRNMGRVSRWSTANGRLPAAVTTDPEEAELAAWWQAKRSGRLTGGELGPEEEEAVARARPPKKQDTKPPGD